MHNIQENSSLKYTYTEIKDFIEHLNESINQQNAKAVKEMLQDLHPADIAELFDELSTKEQSFVIDLLDNEISADILLELEEDDRRKFLKTLTAKEIAEDVINEMDTDDAVDVINELSDEKKDEVIAQLEDQEHAREIVDLLRYDEDTAGGLMGKELIKFNFFLLLFSKTMMINLRKNNLCILKKMQMLIVNLF